MKTNDDQRSVTVGARMDPALNENNDDIDPQARGHGPGRNRGLDRGRARATPRQNAPPVRPARSQRPILMYVGCFCYVSMLTSRSVRTCRADYPTPHRSYRL